MNAKELKIAATLKSRKQIDFGDYIDRDVPHITAGGQFAKTKASKRLQDFRTGPGPKERLFEDLLGGAGTLAGAAGGEDLAALALQGGGAASGDHLPNYLQAAREAHGEKGGAGNQSRVRAFRKAMNDNVVREMGLQNHIQFAAPQYLNLRDLRGLEYQAARQIQALARCFFTRKWYLNYVVRKKLGVPFSGLEFAQNPFLRQFNKPNTYLNRLRQVDGSNMTRAIPSAADLKLSTVQIKRMRNRQQEQMLRIRGNTKMPDDTDGARLIARSLQKGLSPEKIIRSLQDDFLAQGLEAYD